MFCASSLMSAFRFAGTTMRACMSSVSRLSATTIWRNSESDTSAILSASSGGVYEAPALYAASSSSAFILSEEMSRSSIYVPLPRRARRRPDNDPCAERTDSPAFILTLSILSSLLSMLMSMPLMMFLKGRYGVMRIPVRTSRSQLRSHSRKYLAMLPSSLKLMSFALKSSSSIHDGTSLA